MVETYICIHSHKTCTYDICTQILIQGSLNSNIWYIYIYILYFKYFNIYPSTTDEGRACWSGWVKILLEDYPSSQDKENERIYLQDDSKITLGLAIMTEHGMLI